MASRRCPPHRPPLLPRTLNVETSSPQTNATLRRGGKRGARVCIPDFNPQPWTHFHRRLFARKQDRYAAAAMMFACVHSAVVDTCSKKGSETEQQTESASASFAIRAHCSSAFQASNVYQFRCDKDRVCACVRMRVSTCVCARVLAVCQLW